MMKLHDKDTKISEPTHFTMSISPLLQSAIQQQIGVQSEHVVDHHREMIKGVRVIMTEMVVLVVSTRSFLPQAVSSFRVMPSELQWLSVC